MFRYGHAASKDYALYIVRNIILTKPGRKLDFIFFSYHCDISKKIYKGSQKQLKLLWDEFKLVGYNSNNTIIIDDYDHIHEIQPCNCVRAEGI